MEPRGQIRNTHFRDGCESHCQCFFLNVGSIAVEYDPIVGLSDAYARCQIGSDIGDINVDLNAVPLIGEGLNGP